VGCWSGEMRVMLMVRLGQGRIVKSRKAHKAIVNQECWTFNGITAAH